MAVSSEKELYELLRQRAGLPQTATITRALRATYAPGEAELVLAIPRAVRDGRLMGGPGPSEEQQGSTPVEVARETGKDLEYVEKTLHRLWFRSLVLRKVIDGVPHYFGGTRLGPNFSEPVGRTWTEDERKTLGRLVEKYDFQENGILHQFAQFKVPGSAVRVAERAVANKEELEPWESTTEIIKNCKERAIAECSCRVKTEYVRRCDKPRTTCQLFDVHIDFWDGWERGTLKPASLEETLANLEYGQDAGLVSIAPNTADPAAAHWICACCPDCCHILGCSTRLQAPVGQAFVKSNFDPAWNADKCNWCMACVKACPNLACWWHPPYEANLSDKGIKFRLDRCVGCGLCGVSCKTGAIKMHKVRNYVPPPPDDPGRTGKTGWV